MKNEKSFGKRSKKEIAITITYRNNDLFEKYLPVIKETLISLGYKTRTHVFPAGTATEKIKKWYGTHKEELKSSKILADITTIEYGLRDTGLETITYDSFHTLTLDDLMDEATTEAITGDATLGESLNKSIQHVAYELHNTRSEKKKTHLSLKLEKLKQEYLSYLGEMYKKTLTSIPEKKRQKLEVIILKGLFEKEKFITLIDHEPYRPKDNFKELSKETNYFSSNMKKWFNESGISNVTIYSTGSEIPIKTVRKLIYGGAYIVFDRHTHTNSSDMKLTPEGEENLKKFWGGNITYADMIKEKAALETPFETFYLDAQEKIGGISAKSQKIKESIKKRLQEVSSYII